MSDFPERIWLQSEMEGFNVETTWCIDQINDDDAEYIRQAIHESRHISHAEYLPGQRSDIAEAG